MLLATETEWWVELVGKVGVVGVLLLLFGVGIYRAIPKIADAVSKLIDAFRVHIEKLDAANETTSTAVVKLTESTQNQAAATADFAKGLWHAANAADKALEHAPAGMRQDVQPHIDAMRDAVRKR